MAEGIEVRHAKPCKSKLGRKCNCKPTYQAQVYDAKARRTIKRTFATLAAARDWRADARKQVKQKAAAPDRVPTVAANFDSFVAEIRLGKLLNHRRKFYKVGAADGYECYFNNHLRSSIGALRLDEVGRGTLQKIVDRMLAKNLSPSSIANAITCLRASYRWYAARHDAFAHDPFRNLELPLDVPFEFFALPLADVEKLMSATRSRDELAWALAFFEGLRIGEIQALRWRNIDIERRTLQVVTSFDRKRRAFVYVKSDKSDRLVPIQAALLPLLERQRAQVVARFGADALNPDHLVIPGTSVTRPFNYSSFLKRGKEAFELAGLAWRSPHKGRHNYISFAIKALDMKQVADQAGHVDPSFTMQRYAHQVEGGEADAADKLDAYLKAQAEVGDTPKEEPIVSESPAEGESPTEDPASSDPPTEDATESSESGKNE